MYIQTYKQKRKWPLWLFLTCGRDSEKKKEVFYTLRRVNNNTNIFAFLNTDVNTIKEQYERFKPNATSL